MDQQSTVSRIDTQIQIFVKLVAVFGEFGIAAQESDDIRIRRSLYFLLPMWLHAQAMCDSLQSHLRPAMRNLPALAALARATMECFVNLAFFSENVSPAQWDLRVLLWERHLQAKFVEIMTERQPLSDELKSSVQQAKDLQKEIQTKIVQSAGLKEIGTQRAMTWLNAPDKYLTSSQEDIWVRAGLARQDYKYHWKALSQWTHNTPLSISQQVYFGEPANAEEVSMTVRLASEMLYRGAVLVPQLDALTFSRAAVDKVYAEFFPTLLGGI